MFGIASRRRQSFERRIADVLTRRDLIDDMHGLLSALEPLPNRLELGDATIALDASALLRIATHEKSEDIIDFLDRPDGGRIILPSQAIQEYWNNHLKVIETISGKMKKRLEELSSELKHLDGEFDSYKASIEAILKDFVSNQGPIFDEQFVRKSTSLFRLLKEKAIVSSVQRQDFFQIAAQRKMTKTPPGFLDNGDGDFYTWADLLAGVLTLPKLEQKRPVVFLTHDKKPDWQRDGIPHPTLTSELHHLAGCSLTIWDLKKFASEVAKLNALPAVA